MFLPLFLLFFVVFPTVFPCSRFFSSFPPYFAWFLLIHLLFLLFGLVFRDAGVVASHKQDRITSADASITRDYRKRQRKQISVLSSHTHTSKARKTNLSTVASNSFRRRARASFRPSEVYTKQRGTQNKMKESPHSEKGTMFKL